MYSSDEEVDDGLTDYERTCNLIEEKKRLLVERKKRYSELTTAQYNTNQEYIRMQKALKNQTASINAATKRYVDHNVKIALAEADCAYFDSSRKSHGIGFDQEQELADIGMSRELLQDKLNEHRDLKARINEEGNKSVVQYQSLRQECLNVGFYCEDIRAKVETDIRKSLDRHHFDPDNATKQHLRNTNKSAMTVANRVLDCREEVIGFFKQQLMKVKREERIAQEEKELMAERNILKVNSEANTESEMDSFVKKQNIIPSNDESADENENVDENDGDRSTRRRPHPPPKEPPSALLHLANNVKGRGNFIAGVARQKRRDRNSPFAAINIDRIGADFVRGCETEGNTCKLRALKAAMQNHILVQLSFILMMENELNAEKLVAEEAKKNTSEGEMMFVSSASGSRGGSRAGRAGSSASDAKRRASNSKKQKGEGEFGQNMGKLCGLSSASIARDENYVRYTKDYVNALKLEVAEAESDLLETSVTREEVLYSTCVDGIEDPWDASAILYNDVAPDAAKPSASVGTDRSNEFDRKIGAGYRAQTMVALQNRAPLYPERNKSRSEKESKNEKTFGLAKWLDDSIFERKLTEILTAEVKSMNDIPIELGLAKVTSIGIATQQAASAQVKELKERERRTMNLALTNPSAAAAAITNQSAPVEKKIMVKGLDAL